MKFETYYTHDKILDLLVKYRIKDAKKRHKHHLLVDVSLTERPKKAMLKKNPVLSAMFPARRTWIRLKPKERARYSDSQKLVQACLKRTIKTIEYRIKNEALVVPDWYTNLQKFISTIRDCISGQLEYVIGEPKIIPVRKVDSPSCEKCRPISDYDLNDRIIIALTAKYFTDIFDSFFLDCSLAFRSTKDKSKVKNHHQTVEIIRKYKSERKDDTIWVAEGDISKFFDCVNQELVKDRLSEFVEKIHKEREFGVNERAVTLFKQYLASYAFNKTVYPLNQNQDFFKGFRIKNGYFEWPINELGKLYPNEDLQDHRIGVPQGGAISCLIANLIIHPVDKTLLEKESDKDLLYLRFCDDMVILHTDQEKCNQALTVYMEEIELAKLIVHAPVQTKYGADFWESKSKKPYRWERTNTNELSVPWLGFVGYQIRYDGCVRVRKKSLDKEIKKQTQEGKEILKALDIKKVQHLNQNSRKSSKQQEAAFQSRLISMSVGRNKVFNYKSNKPSLCWTNGFKMLTKSHIVHSQLKRLDRNRNKVLFKFRKQLQALKKDSHKPDEEPSHSYFGTPFSYFGFVHNNTIRSKKKSL